MSRNETGLPADVRAIALDLDGVVYVGHTPLPGAVETIRAIRQLGYGLYFVTNNSGQTRTEIAQKLCGMGIPATERQILNSAYAAAVLLTRLNRNASKRVWVVGSDGLKSEIASQGIQIARTATEPCGFLLVGFDRDFSYDKICASLDVLSNGACFIACNHDARFPVPNGGYQPGCGSMVAAIEAAWGKKSDYEAGKPNPILLELVAAEAGLQPGEILVVGDSLESDIAMANQAGAPSVWITTTTSVLPDNAGFTLSLAGLPDLLKHLVLV